MDETTEVSQAEETPVVKNYAEEAAAALQRLLSATETELAAVPDMPGNEACGKWKSALQHSAAFLRLEIREQGA